LDSESGNVTSRLKNQCLSFVKNFWHVIMDGLLKLPAAFADGCFDMVYSKSVLTHLPESSFGPWLNGCVQLDPMGG
jgi:hypothetical protein